MKGLHTQPVCKHKWLFWKYHKRYKQKRIPACILSTNCPIFVHMGNMQIRGKREQKLMYLLKIPRNIGPEDSLTTKRGNSYRLCRQNWGNVAFIIALSANIIPVSHFEYYIPFNFKIELKNNCIQIVYRFMVSAQASYIV